jgi:hypothetical protein
MLRFGLPGVTLVLVLAAAACFAWPLGEVSALKHSLMARDAEGVARRVDFAALKANVKLAAHRKIEEKDSGSVLAPVKDAIIEVIADGKVDRVATPEGMIHLVCDHSTDGDGPSPESGKPCELHGHIQHFGFQSPRRFTVAVRADTGEHFTLVMVRRGWRWQLVDLLKPQDGPASGASNTVH